MLMRYKQTPVWGEKWNPRSHLGSGLGKPRLHPPMKPAPGHIPLASCWCVLLEFGVLRFPHVAHPQYLEASPGTSKRGCSSESRFFTVSTDPYALNTSCLMKAPSRDYFSGTPSSVSGQMLTVSINLP